jgi:hypothetical protein
VTVCHRRGSLTGLCFFVLLSAFVSSASAQSNLPPNPEQLLAQATKLELSGKWNDALQLWCKVYGQDRHNAEANKHIQICLRRIFQAQRMADKSLREKVLSLSHSQALALYTEVLSTLNADYVDRTLVTPDRLFHQGMEEFLISLNDPTFRKQYLKGAREKDVQDFQTRLREYMSIRTVDSVTEAVGLVKQIGVSAKNELGVNQISVVVLEFISGACNSLDEYTSYLSPAELALETHSNSEPSVIHEHLPNGVGYFKITHFRDTTPEEVDAAIALLKARPDGMPLRALLMDLRGNPGGLFSAAVQVVERFVPAGVIVTTQGQLNEFNKVLNAGGKMNVIDLPLVVLVDGGTASAAEILAGAFRDHQRATLVGTATYGKGSIQRVLKFQTAKERTDTGETKTRTGGIRITLARFYTPNGQAVSGAGISPHLFEEDKMRQLEVAIEEASRYVSVMMPR